MLRTPARIALVALSLALLAGACGSDSNDSSGDAATDGTTTSAAGPESTDTTPTDTDESSATTSSTTTPPAVDGTSTTTSAPTDTGVTGVLADGTLTTAGGITTNWSLSATASSLCFEADLSHPDPGVADGIGDGVSACLEPDGGLDLLDSGLSVDVGTVDGDKTIGYLWGRVAKEVISLTIEHANGTQTSIEVLDGPTDVGVFVYVVEIASIPAVQDLDAVSGTQIEGSEPIRGFLRAGPTYPVVTPPPTPTPPEYPVS